MHLGDVTGTAPAPAAITVTDTILGKPPKRKPAPKGRKKRPAAKKARPRKPIPVPELPLQQGLIEMATVGAESFSWVILMLAGLAVVGGLAFGAWSQRPIPSYSSDAVALDTPLDVAFTIQNTSPWFPIRHLKLSCLLMQPGMTNMPAIPASDLHLPADNASTLPPDGSATFKCPFRAALGGSGDYQLNAALRSNVFFRMEYDLPVVGSLRVTDERGPYALDTRLLPPRWTAKTP